jgi:hypothetical protein
VAPTVSTSWRRDSVTSELIQVVRAHLREDICGDFRSAFSLRDALSSYVAEIRIRRERSPWKGPFDFIESDERFNVVDVNTQMAYRTKSDVKAEEVAAALNTFYGFSPDGTDLIEGMTV